MPPDWILLTMLVLYSFRFGSYWWRWYRSEAESRESVENRRRWRISLAALLFLVLLLRANAEIESRDQLIEDQQDLLEEQATRYSRLDERSDREIARVDSLHQEVVSLKSRADSLCSFNLTASD